jgi:hypothetical protein
MKLILFTVEEANQTLPEIRPRLQRLVQIHRDLEHLQRRIDVLSLAASGATEGNPDARELLRLVPRRNQLGDEFRRGVEAIQSSGALIKDVERGLVDFYSIAGDRLIFLCWQLGEPEVGHWHTLEGGFAGRQPLHRSERE